MLRATTVLLPAARALVNNAGLSRGLTPVGEGIAEAMARSTAQSSTSLIERNEA